MHTRVPVALYILNQKRSHLTDLEMRFGVAVAFDHDDRLTGTAYCTIEPGEPATGIARPTHHLPTYASDVDDVEIAPDVAEDTETTGDEGANGAIADGEGGGDSRRKRRRRRGRDRGASEISGDAPQPADDGLAYVSDVNGSPEPHAAGEETEDEGETAAQADGDGADEERGSRRRRSRRGGRRARESRERREGPRQRESSAEDADGGGEIMADGSGSPEHDAADVAHAGHEAGAPVDPVMADAEPAVATHEPAAKPAAAPAAADERPAPEIESPQLDVTPAIETEAEPEATRAPKPEPVSSELDPSRPKRSGWWQRAKATLGG